MKNRTLFTGDNLHVMRGMNDNSVDLIYLDPPFNSNREYAAPVGSEAAGAAFKDTWTLSDVDMAEHGEIADRDPALYRIIDAAGLAHSKSMKSYAIMMALRLLELKRVLKPTGSIYLHCDPTASHYLKALMDCVFGRRNFRNEIVWCYYGGGRPRDSFGRKHDSILRYAMGMAIFNADAVRIPYLGEGRNRTDASKWGSRRKDGAPYQPHAKGKVPEDWWPIHQLNSNSPERTGYPTQKPLALLERIIKASSNEGDLVFDPFCGCATTLVAAEKLDRQWIGCDLSDMAVKLVKKRIDRELGGLLFDIHHRTDIPRRTDLGQIPNYRTHRHTLYGQQEGLCNGCKTHFPFRNMTVDHIVPKAQGGHDHISNLQLLCGACNSLKGTGTHAELLVKLQRDGIIK